MTIEGEQKPAKKFIGDMPFGITTEFIQAHLHEIEKEIAQINEYLTKKDTPEQLRKSAEDRKINNEQVLEKSPDEIFHLLKEVYDFVKVLEQSGLAQTDILQKIKSERPELNQAIGRFYGILRSQVWGYQLGQSLFAFGLQE